MSKITLTGHILDVWETEDRSIFIAFQPNELGDNVIPDLTYYQNTHTEISLSIDGKPPIKIVDLVYEKHEMELKGD